MADVIKQTTRRRTVGDLIDELARYPRAMLCLVDGYESGFEAYQVQTREVSRDRWMNYGGPWEIARDTDEQEREQAILIARVEHSEIELLS